MNRGALAALVMLTSTGGATIAAGETPRPGLGLRARSDLEVATRLMRSEEPAERLRGIERASSTPSDAALALLLRAAAPIGPEGIDPRAPLDGVARADSRALLAVVRGLAGWIDRAPARAALAGIVGAPEASFVPGAGEVRARAAASGDDESGARIQLARREAAVALAGSGDATSLDALVAIGRSSGPGQAPAVDALALDPPASPEVLGGVALATPPMLELAGRIGDRRALDGMLEATTANDPALRAAAIGALGDAGDERVALAARTGLTDADARVRVAAVSALVHLGARDAAQAVEALATDPSTALDGLKLAERVQDERMVGVAAARAVASSDPALRAESVVVLGRQASRLAALTLGQLAADPALQGDAAFALARSPSPASLGVLEALGASPASRRLAARAYFVRRWTRGDRSPQLDRLLASMARSQDPGDRGVGLEALVALGEVSLATALRDPEPAVRRTAAMAVAARATDEARPASSTAELLERVRTGADDAPLDAYAIGRRARELSPFVLGELLSSRDPEVRAHAAWGLGASDADDAEGRLERAYAYEVDAQVRRAIVGALAARAPSAAAGPRDRTLRLAARLEPDAVARSTARRALDGRPAPSAPDVREVAWLLLRPAEGATVPVEVTGLLLQEGRRAVPVAFDPDGFALVPGVAPGVARLRLAPALPSYSGSIP
jgi:HEAT repeat protein